MNNQRDNTNNRANGSLSKINPPSPQTSISLCVGELVGRDWLNKLKLIFADIFGDLSQESNNPLVVVGFLVISLIFYVGA